MRTLLSMLAITLLAACGGGAGDEQQRSSADLKTFDVREEAPPGAGPQIGVTAAPGVAFNYRYAFRLPNSRIAAVQEHHAQACEKLGIDRCRITGMQYRLVGEDDIQGMLSLKLDPAIARAFGKAAVDVVTGAEGMLVDAEISGTDVGSEIEAANRAQQGLEEELASIDRRLAQPGLPAAERGRLEAEARQLRQSARANRANQADRAASLATTPMTFEYGSGDLVAGFDARSPARDALRRAGENFVDGVAMLFVILISLLPWALAATAIWWLALRIRRRFGAASSIQEEPQANETSA